METVKQQAVKQGGNLTQNAPEVSVLMATYNRRSMLPRAIESVLGQTFRDFELIIINDGGEDVSDVASSYNDRRIVYVNAEHNGLAHTLNVGIDYARGEYIAYLDDDDIYYPDHLDVLVEAIRQYPSRQFVYSDAFQVDYTIKDGGSMHVLSRKPFRSVEFDKRRLFEYNDITTFVLHRRSLFYQVGRYDEKLPVLEDWDMWRRFSMVTHFVHLRKKTGEISIRVDGDSYNDQVNDWKIFHKIWKRVMSKNIRETSEITADDYVGEGDAHMKKHHTTEVIKMYQQALTIEPEHITAHRRLVQLYRQIKDNDSAQKHLDELQKLNVNQVTEEQMDSFSKKFHYYRKREGLFSLLIRMMLYGYHRLVNAYLIRKYRIGRLPVQHDTS